MDYYYLVITNRKFYKGSFCNGIMDYEYEVSCTDRSMVYGIRNHLTAHYRRAGKSYSSLLRIVGNRLFTSNIPLSDLETAIQKMRLRDRKQPKVRKHENSR